MISHIERSFLVLFPSPVRRGRKMSATCLPSRLRADFAQRTGGKIEHHASRRHRRLGNPAPCADAGRSPGELSRQAAHPRRALPGRRTGRHLRTPSRPGDEPAARPARADREQERRGGRHRRRLHRQGRHRRPCHGPDERLGRRHHAEPDAQDALRPQQGPGAADPGGAGAGGAGGQQQARHQRPQELHRLRQGPSRQGDLRLGRHRRHHPSRDRAVQARDRQPTSCTCPTAARRPPPTT